MSGPFRGHGIVRKMWVLDRTAFTEHLLRLDTESRRKRFQGCVSDDYITRYGEKAFTLDAVLYGYFDRGFLRAVGELHPLGGLFNAEGEVAFSVEHDYQEQGVGSELFRALTIAARNRSIKRLIMHCLPANIGMRRLAKKFGGLVHIEDGDATAIIKTPTPTPMSLFREALTDSAGFARAVFDAELSLVGAH